MGFKEKIKEAKQSSWITTGMKPEEVKSIVNLARISAAIESKRIDMGMNQKEFAKYMGVSQSMISKWESREYNFTVKNLIEVCEKLDLDLSLSINKQEGE